MTNLWAFLLQTLYVTGVGLLLLAIKTLLKDKLSPRWQYAVWSVLALRICFRPIRGNIMCFSLCPCEWRRRR